MNNTLRVGFVLCSSASQPIPSTRIAVLNMLPYLREAGIDPVIVFDPKLPSETPDLIGVGEHAIQAGCQLVVIQKVRGPRAVSLARQLAAAGVPTVYAVCDLVDVPMVEATTFTVAVTEHLRSLYPPALQSRIHVVHDGIENPGVFKSDWGTNHAFERQRLSAVLVTSAALDQLPVIGRPPAWLSIRIVGRYERGARKWRQIRWNWAERPLGARLAYLGFLLDPRIACVPWNRHGVYREMNQADIGVLPIDTSEASPDKAIAPAWRLKSENRLTMKMSMGLPVIATPIPSYEGVIEHGVNGFLARSPSDWAMCLDALRDSERRRAMGLAARASVVRDYSMDEQAAKLLRAFDAVSTACRPTSLRNRD